MMRSLDTDPRIPWLTYVAGTNIAVHDASRLNEGIQIKRFNVHVIMRTWATDVFRDIDIIVTVTIIKANKLRNLSVLISVWAFNAWKFQGYNSLGIRDFQHRNAEVPAFRYILQFWNSVLCFLFLWMMQFALGFVWAGSCLFINVTNVAMLLSTLQARLLTQQVGTEYIKKEHNQLGRQYQRLKTVNR